MTEAERIAAGLTPAMEKALLALSYDWKAGPTLRDSDAEQMTGLRELGLVAREFGDMGKNITASETGFRVRLSACWYFCLTDLGLAVRKVLERSNDTA